MTSTSTIPRSLRADAARNRELLVAAAKKVFAAEGVDAPLDRVARAAGIGNATMYRNFSTRNDLLEAVLHEVHDDLANRADELLAMEPPFQAVAKWIEAFVDYSQSYLGLPEPIIATTYDETSALGSSCAAMRAGATRLLERAHAAGQLRDGVGILDICALALGIAWATQFSPDDRQKERLLSILLEGIGATRNQF